MRSSTQKFCLSTTNVEDYTNKNYAQLLRIEYGKYFKMLQFLELPM